jgi:hypothetical protein
VTLMRADAAWLASASYALFGKAQQREPWSARDLIADGRTALDEQGVERAWMSASLGYYTEQAGLIAAAELAAQTTDITLRMGLATAVADEARHADAFLTYAVARGGDVADCAGEPYLGELHAILSSAGYLEKCLLHTMFEGLAADEFVLLQEVFAGDPLAAIIRHVRGDEIRHVAIGLEYLRRSWDDPRDRDEWRADGASWERRGLELMNLPAAMEDLGSLLGRPPKQLERWFMRRHRARLRGAGIGPTRNRDRTRREEVKE